MRLCVLMVLAALAGCDDRSTPPDNAKQNEKSEKTEKQPKPDKALSADAAAKFPIATVTLYASGAARLEHKGTVNGDAAVDLPFKAGQVPGVLKSMMVDDGANALSTTLQPIDPAAATAAASRRVNLAENPSRADLLSQLRGAKIRLQVGDEMKEVTLLSIETVEPAEKPAKSDKADKNDKGDKTNGASSGPTRQLNVLSGNALQTIKLDDVRKIELSDPRVQDDLKRAVETLWQKDPDKKTVSVRLRGKGERPARIGYTLEAQPWKVSYRLVLSDKPSLQGWATVANDTDTDWCGVQLNLMGGRPFLLAPDTTADASAAGKAARGAGIPAGESFRRPKPVPSRESLDDERSALLAAVRPEAERTPDGPVVSVQDGFHYTLTDVSVPKQSTAMVPIMSDAITVERVAVYNDALLKRNALQGARIRNTSKHYLLQGAVTVLDDGNYVGDASLDNLAPGRYGLITWGIDLPVLVDASETVHSTAIESAAIDAGVLRLDRQHVYSRQYVMENEDQKDRTLIIEHPIRRGWRLMEPAEAMETTETLYRFRQTLPGASKAKLIVKERITESDGIDLVAADVDAISSLSRDVEIPPSVRDALVKIGALKQSGTMLDRQLQRLQSDLDQAIADQAKARDQETSGPPSAKAANLEKEIQRLRQRITDLTDKQDAARESMESAIRKVTATKATRPIAKADK